MYFLLVTVAIVANVAVDATKNPHCAHQHAGMVHLFEWKWTDIAKECERFLGPYKFCGVQVSPPNEHTLIDRPSYNQNIRFPWYQRYQPVSYALTSRSGNREQFKDMVQRCNRVGVRIFVDAVINHMAADLSTFTGSGGCKYELGDAFKFPCVPYGPEDFNSCEKCGSHSCNIQNYQDVNEVRNCRLVGLPDLDLSREYVRNKVSGFLNDLINIGVAGFRIDAAKHMWPEDLRAIYSRLNNLNEDYFSPNSRPFIAQEVIDLGAEPVKNEEYIGLGRVTEFRYTTYIGQAFQNKNQLKNLRSFGQAWGMLSDGDAFVFVDNHDNQRGHGPGGRDIITSYQGDKYSRAVAFMLAFKYGEPRIMSSYRWEGGPHNNDFLGPPSDADGKTKDVTIDSNGNCENGWACEHRWPAIRNMPWWKAVAGDAPVANWWDDGNNKIAFSRGNRAFIAMTNDGSMSATLQTGLPGGSYCNLATSRWVDSQCHGDAISVGSDGKASIQTNSIVAIHIYARGGAIAPPSPTPRPTQAPGETTRSTRPGSVGSTQTTTRGTPGGWKRTIIFIKKRTSPGENLFLRGAQGNPCQGTNCNVPIRYRNTYSGEHFKQYRAWSVGDNAITWTGANENQGKWNGATAQGSPMAWTTNQAGHPGKVDQNMYGDHYWMWDGEVDTSNSNEWLEVKGFLNGWESDISQTACTGGEAHSFSTRNHVAKAGKINVFVWGQSGCIVKDF